MGTRLAFGVALRQYGVYLVKCRNAKEVFREFLTVDPDVSFVRFLFPGSRIVPDARSPGVSDEEVTPTGFAVHLLANDHGSVRLTPIRIQRLDRRGFPLLVRQKL